MTKEEITEAAREGARMAVAEVFEQREHLLGLPFEAHIVHHQHVGRDIASAADMSKLLKQTLVRYGLVFALGLILWALWEGAKIKLGIPGK